MYPFPQPYPTLRTCISCKRTFRLVDFRRWHGAKRLLFETCKACRPETALSEADPRALQNAVESGRINQLVAQKRIEARAAKASAKRSNAQFKRRVSERRQIWNEKLFTPLRQELTWVKHSISICRLGQAPHFATGLPPPADVAAAYASWLEFFEAYESALKDAQHRAKLKLGLGRTGKLEPTEEEMSIMTYVYPQTLGTLRRLYGACQPIRARRAFRQPWLLQWRTE
jgi:hypothetical protein